MLNLDTHVLIHALRGDLRARERALLSGHPWGIAAIVLWEMAKLAQLGRVDIDLEDPEIETALASVHVWPLDLSRIMCARQAGPVAIPPRLLQFRGSCRSHWSIP